jgi:GntR family transcriptional regulator/MocR family aminotransferase
VLVETPGYTDAYEIFTLQGARLIPLPVDAHGAIVELIPAGMSARLAFVTPSNQFPGGGTMPAQRRLDLLAWAQRADALVIEDDYDGELRYESHPVAAMQGMDSEGRVLYLGTFSKVLFPALRLGYIVLPPGFIEPFLQAKRIVDRGAPTLTQAAVADFIAEGHFQRHLRRLRRAYGRRRQVLIEELQRRLPDTIRFSHEPAGLHIMLYLPPNWSENDAIQAAAGAGVRVYPGRTYYLSEPAPPSVLLGYTGLSEEQIREGILRLATAWETPPLAPRK